MLRLEKIIKNYQTGNTYFPALKEVSLAFRKNEFVSILGPSGCGKTTLLNIIGGLDHYTSGDLVIEGKSTKEYKSHDWDVYRNHRIGFIFQSYNLIPHQNILENVELALTIAGYSKEEKRKKAMDALDMVGLKGAYKKMPNQLSGGQCQRVAIARALVNEPDILLGDEPTGALDSKTSVQVMELIKKISKTKLVIMVTHNPPLAEQYSTRIISLLDGKVVGDTNPYSLDEEKKEVREEFKGVKTSEEGQVVKPDKAKMSFWSAFKLSARNLISKRKRTIMVIAASSIGIVGVSAVLAVSTGVRGYMGNMQNDMLSGNPIRISETALDITSVLSSLNNLVKAQSIGESFRDGAIDIEYLTETLIKNAQKGSIISNDINEDYVNYLKEGLTIKDSGIVDLYQDYQISFAENIYTNSKVLIHEDDKKNFTEDNALYSLQGLKNIYTAVMSSFAEEKPEMDFAPLLNLSANFPNVFYQGLDNSDYLATQYDVVTGHFPEKGRSDQCVVVLNQRNKLADLIVTLSGLLSQEDFIKAINSFLEQGTNPVEYIKKNIKTEDIMKKTFYYVPNSYKMNGTFYEGAYKDFDYINEFLNMNNSYNYRLKKEVDQTTGEDKFYSETVDLEGKRTGEMHEININKSGHSIQKINVVGIITPKEGKRYGSLNSGIYFTSALTNKVLDDVAYTNNYKVGDVEKNSQIYNFLINESNWNPNLILNEGTLRNYIFIPNKPTEKHYNVHYGLSYDLNYVKQKYDPKTGEKTGEPQNRSTYGTVGYTNIITEGSHTYKTEGETKSVDGTIITSKFDVRSLSGRKMIHTPKVEEYNYKYEKIPYRLEVYAKDFPSKDLALKYLKRWNSDETIVVGGKTLPRDQRTTMTYTDNLSLIIAMINNLIDVTTISLTVFAALSLVVSTVMIGIITYISVMERIKEIGVIRSLGGRKKDVSHLFNAETFILGGLSGIFGIIITYIFELILDVCVYANFKIPMIANLKWYTALIMIVLSIVLTAISGLIPAKSAANKDPVNALRSE